MTEANRDQAKPTIVLVHGAWADSSSWSKVVRRLQAQGYTVDVPPNPLRGLASDAASIASFVGTIAGPVVLVGHSYGGAVITNATTTTPNVKALVYVNAFAPAEGETILQLVLAQPGSALAANPAQRSSKHYKAKNADGSVDHRLDHSRVRARAGPERQIRVVGVPRNPILKLAAYLRTNGAVEALSPKPKRKVGHRASDVHRKESSPRRYQSKSR